MAKASGLCMLCSEYPCICERTPRKTTRKPLIRPVEIVTLPDPSAETSMPAARRQDFDLEEALEITAIKNLEPLLDAEEKSKWSEQLGVTLRPHERAAVWRAQDYSERSSITSLSSQDK